MNNVEQKTSTPRMSRPFILVTCGALLGFALSGCATIIHGTHQDVAFSSSPTGAEVWVDGVKVGETPVISKLDAIYVDVEMKPQPGWVLIGQLQRSR